jgi:pyruvate dehydrogenase E2 component (dihydrolipoamide acetyltransferase)
MASEVKLPRLGQGMESGTIVRWLKAEGDRVERGEPLYELDTDKVTQEVEAETSGVLLKIAVEEGEVEVGRTIAYIGEAGEAVTEVSAPAPKEEAKPEEKPAEEPEPEPVKKEAAPASTDGRVKASPLARRIARERGIDLAALTGTGPDGRIVAEDVERATAAPLEPAAPAIEPSPAAPPLEPPPAPGPEGVEVVELSPLRKTIARRLTEAWQAPAFQITMSAEMTRAQEVRERLVERHPDVKPTITDLVAKVCAAALMRHREVNALWADGAIELHSSANIGLAVATAKGLVVPVVHGAERLAIEQVAAARAAVVSRAREGKLGPDDIRGGTFTISNLGMFGVEQFTAVLNPPQAAILAVGAIEDRPVAENGEVVIRPRMTMTLTCDHRTIDGATAAEFLQTVKAFLEEPGLAL